MTLVAEFTIQLGGGTLLTPNTRRRMHWAEQARTTKQQRELGHALGRIYRLSHQIPVAIEHRDVHFTLVRGHGQRLLDLDAIPAACKSYLDGLVDAGLLAGDQPKFCTPSYGQERGPRAVLKARVTA